ncbi:hypothetical protein [Stenomitos frigidus]|uniref:Uncharacterized protein n=1 Tax=Stenomitos frigidus AS-A4 TaxID=2933935 RepID=A0ABV0KKC7_9CYAN
MLESSPKQVNPAPPSREPLKLVVIPNCTNGSPTRCAGDRSHVGAIAPPNIIPAIAFSKT